LKVLSKALSTCDSSTLTEPPLVKAMRKDRYDLIEMMLKLNKDKFLQYDSVLCLTDNSGKNVLHHAVLKQHTEIVRKLLYLDADQGKLRA
jgi:ankyrin repeat protein